MNPVQPSNCHIDHLSIVILTEPEFYNDNAIFDIPEIDYFGKSGLLVSALKAALGDRIDKPYFDSSALRMNFLQNNILLDFSPDAIVDELIQTAHELTVNAGMLTPLPSKDAVTYKPYIPILHAIARLKANVFFRSRIGSKVIPILDRKYFIDDHITDITERKGRHLITGIYRSQDCSIGHGLLITNEKSFVRLPANDPKWAWENINDVLNYTSHLEFGVYQDKKNSGEWHPYPKTRICRQDKLIV